VDKLIHFENTFDNLDEAIEYAKAVRGVIVTENNEIYHVIKPEEYANYHSLGFDQVAY
jgi:hypothetical protein